MARRIYGRRSLRGTESVNLNRCSRCQTANPSLPGKGLPDVCSGCGAKLWRDKSRAGANAFTPPKPQKPEEP